MLLPRTLESQLKSCPTSLLVLGPRQTGKSTLIKQLKPELSINLFREQTFLEFAKNPLELEQRLAANNFKTIFIDEIQRLPSLLNTIQTIIDDAKNPPLFYLTGSSARKLKRGKANLLPGRILSFNLGPLTLRELNYDIDFNKILSTGALPGIYTNASQTYQKKILKTYATTYLKEEIQAEALTRNIEGFSRFLFVAAQCSGQYLDLSKLANQAKIPRQTAVRFFEILEDTLIVNRCHAFAKSDRKRLIQHPKFYFFDTGALNALLGGFGLSDDRKGFLFEHVFHNQLITSAQHLDKDIKISTYRTEHGAEVDFIIDYQDKVWAVEIKASADIGQNDTRGLNSFENYYNKKHQKIIAYLGTTEKKINGCHVMPWVNFFKKLGL